MVAAVVGVALLGGLAVFQVSLIAGAPLGRFAWGGQHVVLPTGLRIGSAVSIVVYGLVAALLLQVAGALDVLPRGVADVAIWVLTAYFAVGVLMNGVSRSVPERLVMTPVALALTVVCLVLALQ
ncbi:hypothetical protein [Modestobacter sp. VKM Ac-2984]|uniref:hypothetical protein n=1 Tax=Modestobacter sp. VKM Ac-2984 TaxID=3004138 RepID=UPI0022AA2B3F|nr:hypothetical protein [Modestobacter sp. VKM Ac-2984]MCZ2818192.1 hypothetical protein [Modestobacter sp. VKM Ac-2984]